MSCPELNHVLFYRVKSNFVSLFFHKRVPSQVHYIITRLNSGTKASPKYFHIGDRKENIIHCQMRNDASSLNLHLQQHHLSDRPSCPHCNDACESPSHYFLHCPLYNIHRQQLVDSFNLFRLIKECTARKSFTF
jgi:hypothetical protein